MVSLRGHSCALYAETELSTMLSLKYTEIHAVDSGADSAL